MPSKLQNLNTIFEGVILRIPDYQRGYSWEEKHLQALWNDLKNINIQSFHFTGILTLEGVSLINKDRWIKESDLNEQDNTVVISGKKYTPYFVVDGQQRLVSLITLISVLKNSIRAFNNLKRTEVQNKFINIKTDGISHYIFGYEKDTPSHQYLIGKIFEDETMIITEPETIYTHNLDKAKRFFIDKINDLEEARKEYLFNKITNNLLFNVFEISGPKVDMSLVFETLNYRGKQLSKLELFKNRLIFLITKRYPPARHVEFREKVIKAWQDIYEWLGKNPKNNLDDDDFLRAFWILYFRHDDRKDEDFKKFEQDIFENKYRITDINENNFLTEHNISNLLNALSASIVKWFFIHNPYSGERCFKYEEEIRYFLEKLLRNRYGEFMKPLIMAYLLKNKENTQIKELIKSVERHNYCVYFLAGKKSDTNRPHFYRIINQYYRQNGPATHLSVMSEITVNTNTHLNYDNFFNHMHRNRANNMKFFDWNGSKYTLWEWEEYLKNECTVLIKEYSGSVTELIFPSDESLKRHDPTYAAVKRQRNTENINKLCYSMGNITITNTGRMPSAYNLLKEKLSTGSYSDRDIARRYNGWNDINILDRGIRMLSFIESRWNVVFGNENEKKRYLLDGVQVIENEE